MSRLATYITFVIAIAIILVQVFKTKQDSMITLLLIAVVYVLAVLKPIMNNLSKK